MAKSCRKSPEIFPVLESQSYSEVINDTTQFVSALQVNQPLQTQFITLLRGPNRRKLLKLIKELQTLQEMPLYQSSGKEHSDASFTDLLSHLSTSPSLAIDQVKALTIAIKAFRELPDVSTERILKLTAEEKSNLFILFKKIPFFSLAHGFLDPALPESDPVYTQLLSKIGFTNCRGHLLYEKQISPSGLDLHIRSGRREPQLPVYESDSYTGVRDEAAEFVKALTTNTDLQKAFIELLQRLPDNNLLTLSRELHAVQERLVQQSVQEEGSTSFPELLGHLSTSSSRALEEVKALTIATDASRELSIMAVKRIASLTSEEKKDLFDLFAGLPRRHCAHTHTFSQQFKFSDSLYIELLQQIGFDRSRGGHLSFQLRSDVDIIAVTITVILATAASTVEQQQSS